MSYRDYRNDERVYNKYRNDDRDYNYKNRSRDRSRDRFYNNRRSRSRSRSPRDNNNIRGRRSPDLYKDIINQDYDDSANSYSNSSRDNKNYYGNNNSNNNDKRSRERDRGDRGGRFGPDNFQREMNYNNSSSYNNNRDYRDKDYRKYPPQNQDSGSNYDDSNYQSDSQSDPGDYNTSSVIPNNKLIIRGLVPHLTEADIQADLIQCGLKPVSVRLIRKKKTGQSRGFAFAEFNTVEEAKTWYQMKQGYLVLQDQYRAIIQYSFLKDSGVEKPKEPKIPTDWYCGKCGVFNFKRRENCFKCYASREESEKGGEGSDEVSNILTKKIMFRNLDALTNEEGVLCVLQDVIPDLVSKISKVLICRDQLTSTSRGICYLYFDNLVDSMNTLNALKSLEKPLEIDNREVIVSYCMDTENRNLSNASSKQAKSSYNDSSSAANMYQYSLADVPRLAEYSASLYSTTPAERDSYIKFYTDYYTQQISQGLTANLPTFSQFGETANSGAAVANAAIERKYKTTTASPMIPTAPQVPTPKGNDGKKYPVPDTSVYQYDETSGYYYDPYTGLYYDPTTHYYYNTETSAYMYWDPDKSTYVLATSSATTASSSTVAATTDVSATVASFAGIDQAPPPPPAISQDAVSKEESKKKDHPQDKVKVAKKIVKDMEKWAKQLNQKKEFAMNFQPQRSEDSQSPPMPQIITKPIVPETGYADVGFSILEKKDRTSALSILASQSSALDRNKLVPSYGSDSDNEHDEPGGGQVNEKDYVDFEKLTCLLCKRAFQSPDILSKHLKMSNLHLQNLQKYKLQRGAIDGPGASSSQGSYRDRAKERRQKYGEADPPPINKSRERFNREMEKQAALVAYQQSTTLASQPISENNVGNKLLQKMGWSEGQGLGRSNQGRTEIIETEARISNAGLGSKNSSYGAGAGDCDYKTYIKKMMKSRYEQAS